MTIQRGVSGRKERKWKSVQCNWDKDDGIAFWLTPPLDTSNGYLPAKSTVRDCSFSVVNLVKVLGGLSEGLELQVCPVTNSDKNFLRRFEMVCHIELDGVNDRRQSE